MPRLNSFIRTAPLFCFMMLAALMVHDNSGLHGNPEPNNRLHVVFNPYEQVDWNSFSQHKAALHVHTLQSDSYHMLSDVVHAYRDAGFTILAITDHDWNYPNARVGWGHVPEEEASPYPDDPKPDHFPANTTWPWTDYGGPDPADVGLVGIETTVLLYKVYTPA